MELNPSRLAGAWGASKISARAQGTREVLQESDPMEIPVRLSSNWRPAPVPDLPETFSGWRPFHFLCHEASRPTCPIANGCVSDIRASSPAVGWCRWLGGLLRL